MIKARIPETDEGIQEQLAVGIFDSFARHMRDKGWNNVDTFTGAGITAGNVLEIGPGPGYVGLEWLKKCPEGTLTAIEISPEMIRTARRNADEYGFTARAAYTEGNCMDMPFADRTFDAVFSNGSLHEWENPVRTFNEIARVLKKGGSFCIADLRRDIPFTVRQLLYHSAQPAQIRPGFLSSLYASYTVPELLDIAAKSSLTEYSAGRTFSGLFLKGSV
jgi:Methylase involved in ubiquinone/menaquinone biosynthesis